MTEPTEDERGSGRSLPPAVRRAVAGTVVLFWVVLLVLVAGVGLPLLDGLLLAVLLVVVPGLSLAQLPLVREVPVERMSAYLSSIVTLWILGTAAWFVGTRVGGSAAVGLVPLPLPALLTWSAGLTLGGLLTIVAFREISIRTGTLDSQLLRQLLPRTREEAHTFGVLSVAAGFGEEIAYRGYAIPVLAPLLGLAGSAVLTSVVFGIMHGYQGTFGMLRTGVLGGMLAWGFLASGSLWPAIVAHTIIDLVAGLWLGERLLSPRSV